MSACHEGEPDWELRPTAEGATIVHHLARAAELTPGESAFTFVDYAADPSGRRNTVTWAELHERATAMAEILVGEGATGERVAVVAPQGLEYVVGFLAALRAGAIAVPLFPPSLPGHDERLASALADARPVCLLTTSGEREALAEFFAARRIPGVPLTIAVDSPDLDESAAGLEADMASVRPRPEDCAYLQYTSGSTRAPSGVEITHANVVANVHQALEAFDIHRDRNHVVSWLPLFHDMGLVLALAIPVVGGIHSVITDPLAFVQQPVRWLRLLSDYRGAFTAAPNFAYDYCARRVREEHRADLALHHVAVMINGSEPIRPETLSRFQEAFGPCGVREEMIRPSYGLAEATVFVSTSPTGRAPRVTSFDRELLGQGVAGPVTEGAATGTFTRLVACGRPVGQEVVVVDPETCRRLPDGSVGEIWVRGPNVARGYWRSPQRTAETFTEALAESVAEGPAGDPARARSAAPSKVQSSAQSKAQSSAQSSARGRGKWLRTGDLGVMHDGGLYVTGRIKDLIIVDGTNHYPQDIEATVQEAHALIRYDHVAAFALTVDGEERLVIVAEHSRRINDPGTERDAVARAVREAVGAGHGAPVHDFVLAPPGTVPRTSSGKVARSACRRHYLAGTWTERVGMTAGLGRSE
ncbi:fatty acyl-AMP ligase [Wenjunlia tyrosinilytica]|uniref:Nitrate ABC transporter substrate-binding protein n=1 Tax=Wenjunlia tyrosinilytica TaxID=1544741 RepID=A0A917ZRL8_9ACTN|nr:fatty acyl-AMP ligase [Wenjunlia tyrosinilytica]GGO89800.1 nitrate ABC transporter substrate-binding protein [Wenjunlia tyrosinilytica]